MVKVDERVKRWVLFVCMCMCCMYMYVVFIVHRLRPGDIDVVAALGDSATVSSTVLLSLTS